MNKKYLSIFIGVFAISLITAGVVNYLYSQEIIADGNQVEIIGEPSQEISCDIGAECFGSEVELYNDLSMNALMSLTSENDEGVSTKYVSELNLTQKVVDFSLDVWELLPGGNTAVVEYTLVGDEFTVEVIEGGLEGYVLVYYKDNSDRFNSPAEAILIEDVEGNLPYENDANKDEYNYCETKEYLTCNGGKIWYLPQEAVDSEGIIDWSRASEFLFETELIQYHVSGEITVYPEQVLLVTPVVTIEASLPEGNYSSIANIARLA